MTVTVLHTADTHLGYRQYHNEEREEDFQNAFHSVIDAAIEEDVDAVVHGGDLFHQSRPSIQSLNTAVSELGRLREANIPLYIVVGNHDGTRNMQWPDFFETLGLATYLGTSGIELRGEITLYGLDHVGPGKRDSLDYQFSEPDTRSTALIAHGLFDVFPHGDWDTGRLLSRSNVDFNAILLGDDHNPQVEWVEDTMLTYPGSTERTAADQRANRGYNIISFTSGGLQHEFHEIETRPFTYVDVELREGDGIETVIRQVEQTNIGDGDVVIVTIEGAGKRFPTADVEEIGAEKGALTVRVNDRREHTDEEPEYGEVNFADPDDVIDERKGETNIGPVAAELESLARDETVPETALKDESEELVMEMVEERPIDEFYGTGEDTVDPVNAISDSDDDQDQETDMETESQTEENNTQQETEPEPNETTGNDDGQMTLGQLGGDQR